MKRIIALLISVVMLFVMLPTFLYAGTITVGPLKPTYTGATMEKLNDPERDPDDDSITPLAGYHYEADGFHMESPIYSKSSLPYTQIATTESFNLTVNNDQKNGHVFSAVIRVDKFMYDGGIGKDEWICLGISNSQNLNPGEGKYQDGWFVLIRGTGDGNVQYCPCLDAGNTFDGSFPDFTNGTAEFDDQGRELYKFTVDYDNGKWIMTVNGTDVSADSKLIGDDDQTSVLESFSDNAYFNVVAQTGYIDEENKDNNKIELTVTEMNGNIPYGDDAEDPVSDNSTFAEIADSSTVPANTPAVVWDSNKTCFRSYGGSGTTFSDNEDGTIHILATTADPYISWSVKKEISYEAKDFPIVAVLTKSILTDIGSCYYCAGSVVQAENSCSTSWDPTEYDLGNDWSLGTIDLTGLWEGRINSVRISYASIDIYDEEACNFDIGFIGCFRSIDEAREYTYAYLKNLGLEEETTAEETTTEEITTADAENTVEEVTATDDKKTTIADATSEDDATSVVEEKREETTVAEKTGGCKSTVGGLAVLSIIALAGVSLKKKH